jgi:hypothetical protein
VRSLTFWIVYVNARCFILPVLNIVKGNQGNEGGQGETGAQEKAGESGDSTTVIVVPPESTTQTN